MWHTKVWSCVFSSTHRLVKLGSNRTHRYFVRFLARGSSTYLPRKFFKCAFPASFCFFRLFNKVDSKMFHIYILPITGYEPRTKGIRSDRSTSWATPLPHKMFVFFLITSFILKMGHPRLVFHLCWSNQANITIITTNICEKGPSSICCRRSNPWPSEHDSPPITTRPGLPPSITSFICLLFRTGVSFWLFRDWWCFHTFKISSEFGGTEPRPSCQTTTWTTSWPMSRWRWKKGDTSIEQSEPDQPAPGPVKMGQSRPLFCLFLFFSHSNLIDK